ncbi:M14 family zinc carboxypeptidase [Streptomyces sp. NPDC054784]
MSETLRPHGVPPFNDYPTVSELHFRARAFASRHPARSGVRRVGTSRAGEELLLLSVGTPDTAPDTRHGPGVRARPDGHRDVLVVAGPHANERVGGATALRLAEHVVGERPLRGDGARDVRWHFLLCLDPDGARMNEHGATGTDSATVAGTSRNTLLGYHRPFFRPPGKEQPEWAPSLTGNDGELLPESRALLTVIDELRPFLQCSLHANDVGGSWVQLTRAVPGLPEPFAKSAADLGIPVEIGSIDTLYWPSPGPGVFVMPEPGVPERLASLQEDAARSTWYHPHRYGGMTAVVEAPMWASRLVDDCTPVPDSGPAVRGAALRLRRRGRRVAALLDRARPLVPAEHARVLRGAEAAVEVCPGLADDWTRLSRAQAQARVPGRDAARVPAPEWAEPGAGATVVGGAAGGGRRPGAYGDIGRGGTAYGDAAGGMTARGTRTAPGPRPYAGPGGAGARTGRGADGADGAGTGAGVPAPPALTAGHLASFAGVTWRIPLRAAAMLLGALDGVPGRAAGELRAELAGIVSAWCAAFECEFQTRWVPLDDQVRHQARTVLAVLDRVGHGRA